MCSLPGLLIDDSFSFSAAPGNMISNQDDVSSPPAVFSHPQKPPTTRQEFKVSLIRAHKRRLVVVSVAQEFIAVRVQDPRVQNEGSWNSHVDYKIFLHVSIDTETAVYGPL